MIIYWVKQTPRISELYKNDIFGVLLRYLCGISKVPFEIQHKISYQYIQYPGLILGVRSANERRHYKVTPSLIGWA